jgi:hypothetical protein
MDEADITEGECNERGVHGARIGRTTRPHGRISKGTIPLTNQNRLKLSDFLSNAMAWSLADLLTLSRNGKQRKKKKKGSRERLLERQGKIKRKQTNHHHAKEQIAVETKTRKPLPHCPLPITHYPLRTTHCQLPTTHYHPKELVKIPGDKGMNLSYLCTYIQIYTLPEITLLFLPGNPSVLPS